MTDPGFASWDLRRARLGALLAELATTLDGRGGSRRAGRLRQRAEALAHEVFRLMVVGEFKRGKSTLINALIGAEILPAKVAPCTAAITVVRFGEVPRARIVPLDGPPQEVPVSALREWVVREDARDPLPIRRIEVEVPLELLRQGVEIVDSPGLNEHRVRSEIALDFLPRSDALIVVLSCEQALAATEVQFLKEQVGERLRHVFFVWNRFDAIAGSPDDVADLRATSARWLDPLLDPACREPRVHYVSSRDALRARVARPAPAPLGGDRDGLAALERALAGFLGAERAPVKLAAPSAAGLEAVAELLAGLDERERLMEVPLQALQQRYAALAPELAALEAERLAVGALVEAHRDRMVAAVTGAWAALVSRLEGALPEVVASVDLSPLQMVMGAGQVERRLGEQVDRWFQEEVRTWEARELRPLVEAEVAALHAELHVRVRRFLGALDAVRDALRPHAQVRVDTGARDPTGAERVIGAVGGLLLGGLGAAMEGASYGPNGMLRGLAWHLTLGLGLLAAGAGAPVVLAAGAALGAVRLLWEGRAGAERVRTAVVTGSREALERARETAAADLQVRVEARFLELHQELDGGLASLVDELRAQVETVLAEKAAGARAVEEAHGAIAADRRRLGAIGSEIEALRG